MSDERNPCEALGPEVTALVRGELSPAEEAPVRAHLASCPACTGLARDVARIRAAAAARGAPVPDGASRARLDAALGAAWEEEEERERARGPVLRLLDRAGRRYAESRTVRFFTLSLAAHAAAAVLLGIYLGFTPGAGPRETGPVEVSHERTLPPVYGEDPPAAPEAPPASFPPGSVPGIDPRWPLPETAFGGRPPAPTEDPPDLSSSLRLYPNAESRLFAAARFRHDREKLLARVYGGVEGPRVALSVERGVRWLAATQDPDGTWPSGRPGDPKAVRERFRGGVTGTALLALLGDGRTAMRPGPYAGIARSAVSALVRSGDPGTGLLGTVARGFRDDRPLCNNAPALEALAEAYALDYGLLPREAREAMERVLRRAVAATLSAQLPDGSFGYTPDARQGDSSVTLLQVRALESARRAGFDVDPAALGRAGTWLAARIGPDGRLGYREAGDRAGDGTLTAEALTLARTLGIPEEVRARMLEAVLAEGRSGGAADRLLFRTALLESVSGGDAAALALGPGAARATLGTQDGTGAFPAYADRYARAAGDVLSTARVVRALTAPYRGGL